MPTSGNMINTGGPTASDAGASRGTMRQTALEMPGGDGMQRQASKQSGRRNSKSGAPGQDGQGNDGGRRASVEEVLNQFRQGNRDVNNAYQTIKTMEQESIPDIMAALE